MDPKRFEECVFYLSTYGSYSAIVTFYVNHNHLKLACRFILEKVSIHLEPAVVYSETATTASSMIPCQYIRVKEKILELVSVTCKQFCLLQGYGTYLQSDEVQRHALSRPNMID